jgi:DNA repair photolyase
MTTTKNFKGRAIYNPSGKAGEYSYWACNFFIGCSNDCSYCYCKKGVLGSVMGGNVAKLKACFKDEADALRVFEKELKKNLDSLREHGLFFTFTSDPMLDLTMDLTMQAIDICIDNRVPIKILTKNAENTTWNFLGGSLGVGSVQAKMKQNMDLIAIGFTLTGHDELEPGASPNADRIQTMRELHEAGFKTFASIEPIVDFNSSFEMIKQTAGACDLYKIGLMANKKFDKIEAITFYYSLIPLLSGHGCKVYFKDSFINLTGLNRDILVSIWDKAVQRDYNLFNV